jgi:hypothetical protein
VKNKLSNLLTEQLFATAIFGVTIIWAAALLAAPRVELEVVFQPSIQTNATAQKWTKTLSELGLRDVRFRPIQSGEGPALKTEGSGETAVSRVTAVMNNRGALVTPGGQFTLSDGAKLKQWLGEVQATGGKLERTLYGLLPKQFEEIKRQLAAPVGFSTKGMRPEKAIEQIRAVLTLPLQIDPAVAQAVAGDDPVRDELEGISLGTALAAIARPAGAVLLPKADGNRMSLALIAPRGGVEGWPIGWQPEMVDQSKIVPKLFDFTHVDIDGVPASKAIDAIADYAKVPFVFDYNNMAQHRVDLKKPVKVPAGQSYYRRILDRVLFQAGLKAEIRLDDANSPILWITTQ